MLIINQRGISTDKAKNLTSTGGSSTGGWYKIQTSQLKQNSSKLPLKTTTVASTPFSNQPIQSSSMQPVLQLQSSSVHGVTKQTNHYSSLHQQQHQQNQLLASKQSQQLLLPSTIHLPHSVEDSQTCESKETYQSQSLLDVLSSIARTDKQNKTMAALSSAGVGEDRDMDKGNDANNNTQGESFQQNSQQLSASQHQQLTLSQNAMSAGGIGGSGISSIVGG